MGTTSEFDRLRAKTDRQLAAIINNELERGLGLAQMDPNTRFAGGADGHLARAERAYSEARKLLPKVYNLSERLRLEVKLKNLRETLDAVAERAPARARAVGW
jgi:hypothetical protein